MSWEQVRRDPKWVGFSRPNFYGPIVRNAKPRSVIDVKADFGMFMQLKTYDDIQKLIDDYDQWIPALRQRYMNIKEQWDNDNGPQSYDWLTDLVGLEGRWKDAHDYCDSFHIPSLYEVIVTDAAIVTNLFSVWSKNWLSKEELKKDMPAEERYLKFVWAIRQKGEGEAITKGDYSDLIGRITAEEAHLGITPDPQLANPSLIQDPTMDPDSKFLKATDNIPTPQGIMRLLELVVAGVAAGFVVQLVMNAVALRREGIALEREQLHHPEGEV
jgi:hypothetical protein